MRSGEGVLCSSRSPAACRQGDDGRAEGHAAVSWKRWGLLPFFRTETVSSGPRRPGCHPFRPPPPPPLNPFPAPLAGAVVGHDRGQASGSVRRSQRLRARGSGQPSQQRHLGHRWAVRGGVAWGGVRGVGGSWWGGWAPGQRVMRSGKETRPSPPPLTHHPTPPLPRRRLRPHLQAVGRAQRAVRHVPGPRRAH